MITTLELLLQHQTVDDMSLSFGCTACLSPRDLIELDEFGFLLDQVRWFQLFRSEGLYFDHDDRIDNGVLIDMLQFIASCSEVWGYEYLNIILF